MVKKQILIVLLMCINLMVDAQVNCFVQTQMDRSTVYAQQPFKVTINVLTATWYTAPLEFDNFQIPNAFIMPFDKTVPGMFDIKGQKYAGLTFYYIIFPYKEGRYTLPPINIVATTPPVGDYKAIRVNIKMQPLSYIVKPVPKGFSSDSWFVAKDVSIEEKWNKSLSKLKVGDVISSTIIINAKGTLPQFIPELKADNLGWAGVYPQPATLTDTRDEYDANGQRVQSVTYLLEKEGDFTFPQASVEWFNPLNSRVYKRNTPLIKIHVAANPNLGILKTAKDSLKATLPVKASINVKKGPYLIYGIPWYYFALYSIAAICLLYFIIRFLVKIYGKVSNWRKAYLLSEKYWFSKFTHSSVALPKLLNNLYAWWDRFPVAHKSASLQKDAESRNEIDIDEQLAAYYKQEYADGNLDAKAETNFKTSMKKYRKGLMHTGASRPDENITDNQTEWK
jgi:BatD DUF11 like domain